MKECIYASNKINYIKRRHRAYLWMFRAIPSVDIDNKTGTVTIMWCKYAFGKIFVMGEEVRKFEDDANTHLEELKKTWLEGNWHEAQFGTPEERRILQNKKREETMKSNIGIARVCHEANRQYCINNKLSVYPVWDEAPKNIQHSVIQGVKQVIADPKMTATEMHEKWMEYKASEGWKYAEVLDVEKKLHPNLVVFNKLPKAERGKDMLFIRTIRAELKK